MKFDSKRKAFSLFYSDHSDVHVLFQPLPPKVSMVLSTSTYPNAVNLNVSFVNNKTELGQGVPTLCDQLDSDSFLYQQPRHRMGGLFNAATRTCAQVTREKNGSISLILDKCWYRGGGQHVELTPTQQLTFHHLCLGAYSDPSTKGGVLSSLLSSHLMYMQSIGFI
jgi:hypothetical protein